jgi:hypothetical protein
MFCWPGIAGAASSGEAFVRPAEHRRYLVWARNQHGHPAAEAELSRVMGHVFIEPIEKG